MLLALLMTAQAKSIPLNFQDDRMVYTWPASWRPDGVSAKGIEALEEDTARRHYPFYVVLIQGEALPGSGDGMVRLQAATDALMSRWGGQGMDLSEYSVFSVAWGDDCDKPPSLRQPNTVCKFFLNTGSTFINGPAGFLPSRDHEPFTSRFLDAVSTTPQDPTGGILAVIDSVDDMLWERTDPEVLAGRAVLNLREAAAYRTVLLEEASELEGARYAHQVTAAEEALRRRNTDEMVRMAEEMRLNSETLAARIAQREGAARGLELELIRIRERSVLAEPGELDALMTAADVALSRGDLDVITDLALRARSVNGDLADRAVARREAEQRTLQAQLGALTIGGGVLFAGIIGIGARRRRLKLARAEYEAKRDRIATGLDNAAARYMNLELDNRETIAALQDTDGRTGEECRAVSAELDDIYAGIRALESHLDAVDALVARSGPLAVAPIRSATDALTETFSYDTGELTHDDLFGGETRLLAIDGGVFMSQLQDRFAAVVERRSVLLMACESRFQSARAQLPHHALDALLSRLSALQVSALWVSDHPLFGDDDADQTLYDRLDDIRQHDPLAYLEALEAHRAVEAAGAVRVEGLEAALSALAAARLEIPPMHPLCVLKPGDNPAHTFSRARGMEDIMHGLVAEGAVTHLLGPVIEKAEETRQAWLTCHKQAAEIRSAIAGIEEVAACAEQQLDAASAVLVQARSDLSAATGQFSRAQIGLGRIKAGEATLSSAQALQHRVSSLRGEGRTLDAHRTLAALQGLAGQASEEAHQARDLLRRLEDERREYLRRLESMAARRASAVEKVQKYGGSAAGLPAFRAPSLSGPQDFSDLCRQLNVVEEAWSSRVRTARRAHEDDQRWQREAAERTRQAAAQSRQTAARSSHTAWKSSASGSTFQSTRRRTSTPSSPRSSGGGGSFGSGGRSSGGGGGW
ncbi:MAG: hypothetical protein P8R54_30015 [Myxococcota bacterium]|nr:hypothetical protein [Myxococcota bacterium]